MEQNTHPGRLESDSSFIATLRTLLLCLLVGALIGGAAVTLIRAVNSETDGLNALKLALLIIAPLFGLFVLIQIVTLKTGATGKFNGKFISIIFAAIAVAVVTWIFAPTRWSQMLKLIETNRDFLEMRAGQFVAIKQALEKLPDDESVLEGGFNGEVSGLKEWSPKLSSYYLANVAKDFDATYVELSEFARLDLDTDPDSVLPEYDLPDPELIGVGGRRMYFVDSPIDDLAACAYGESPFYRPGDVQGLLDFLRPLKQVIVVRMQSVSLPQITGGKEFFPGFFPGQAHVFDLESGSLIGSFSFAATNSTQINYTYRKNEGAAAKDGSAMAAIEKDLRENGGLAFMHRIKQIAPSSVTGYEKEISAMPYEEASLAAALLGALKEKRLAQDKYGEALRWLASAEQTPVPEPVQPAAKVINLDEETRTLLISVLKDEGKISAIKELRELTGASLKDSKAYVESLQETSDSE